LTGPAAAGIVLRLGNLGREARPTLLLPLNKEILMQQIRKRLTYANVMSSIAVFLVVGGGTAFALGANTVGTPQLKRNAVKVGKIGPEAVKAGKLAKNAVPTNRIRDNAVSASKIAAGSILTDKIAPFAVTTDKIAKEAVTDEKIAKEAVTTEKIANDAVTTEKIANNAVTNAKIANEAVSNAKLSNNAVTNAKIANNAVTSAKILNGQVRAGDLGALIEVQNVEEIANNESGTSDVPCPAGTTVISGGGFTGSFTNMDLVTSIRVGNGWRVQARNETGSSKPLTARAYCLQG
jgi:hypothetical protein